MTSLTTWFHHNFGKGEPKRYSNEQWYWRANIPAAVVLFTVDRPLWDKVSVLYLVVVSIYALDATFGGAKEAAKAKHEARKALAAEGGTATDAIEAVAND